MAVLDRTGGLIDFQKIATGNPAFSLSGIPGLLNAEMGVAGAAGVMHRAGRSSFKYLFDAWGDALGFTSVDYKLLPQPRRIRNGLKTLTALFTDTFGYACQVTEEPDSFSWQFIQCPFCNPAAGMQPACFIAAGLIQEFFAWASGGKYFPVAEKHCIARGEKCCEIFIDKKPLD